ncbi:hypothetical protein NGRA_1544 [Nosema granulosis]|uniref:Uncharacterized protein n=1 Tax=Nosema granulosis TaxID=83296 RepID=A0A9P6KZH2_9MICR|nr:hypothetical protein NGRA_1544 [Nosema granulosis]
MTFNYNQRDNDTRQNQSKRINQISRRPLYQWKNVNNKPNYNKNILQTYFTLGYASGVFDLTASLAILSDVLMGFRIDMHKHVVSTITNGASVIVKFGRDAKAEH